MVHLCIYTLPMFVSVLGSVYVPPIFFKPCGTGEGGEGAEPEGWAWL